MRMARLHVNGKLHPFIPINIEAIDTETDVWINTRYRCHKIDETIEQAEAEINAALRDIEGAEQRTRLDELLSDCLRKEAADDTA